MFVSFMKYFERGLRVVICNAVRIVGSAKRTPGTGLLRAR